MHDVLIRRALAAHLSLALMKFMWLNPHALCWTYTLVHL